MRVTFEIDGAKIKVEVDDSGDIVLTVDEETVFLSPLTAELLAYSLLHASSSKEVKDA